MAKLDTLIADRLKKGSRPENKVRALATLSSDGSLSTFSGLFGMTKLNESEEEQLKNLLTNFSLQGHTIEEDFHLLLLLTQEVKAISHQAILLHGERIQKAQQVLKNYREGAFSAWLVATYGNRQTPYNFLQYFEFYGALEPKMQTTLEKMPRQAIYTLASRKGPFEQKISFIERFAGETKETLLKKIRDEFPLLLRDRRRKDFAEKVLQHLEKVVELAQEKQFRPHAEQRQLFIKLINSLKRLVDG